MYAIDKEGKIEVREEGGEERKRERKWQDP